MTNRPILTTDINKNTIMKDGITSNELKYFQRAHDLGLTPKIISINNKKDEKDNGLNITMEIYEKTIHTLIKENNDDFSIYETKIKQLIDVLHKNNILHGDLHANNIVCSKDGKDIKLIDFEFSLDRNLITEDNIAQLGEMWYHAHSNPTICMNVEELFEVEKNLWKQ